MTTPQLSDFLKRCVSEEVVDEKTAVRLQRYARSAGCGVVEAVEGLSLQLRFESFERGVIEFRDLAFFAFLAAGWLWANVVALKERMSVG